MHLARSRYGHESDAPADRLYRSAGKQKVGVDLAFNLVEIDSCQPNLSSASGLFRRVQAQCLTSDSVEVVRQESNWACSGTFVRAYLLK